MSGSVSEWVRECVSEGVRAIQKQTLASVSVSPVLLCFLFYFFVRGFGGERASE